MQYWNKFYNGLDKIRDRGLGIIILAHNEIKTYSPPDSDQYDRYQIKLHRHAATKLEEWGDCVLFANFKVYVDGDEKRAVNTEAAEIFTRVLFNFCRWS